MVVITLAGKAGHGKDFCGKLIKEKLEQKGNIVLTAHFGDLVKYIATTFFDWDGKKDEKGRSLLQYIGTNIIRKKKPDFWVNFLIDIFDFFPNKWDYALIPDARFPNENDGMKNNFETKTIRINRLEFDNGLTEEQKQHESETALDNYDFDYYITNSGDENIQIEINEFIKWLDKEWLS